MKEFLSETEVFFIKKRALYVTYQSDFRERGEAK